MTDPALHDVVVSTDGVFIDGERCPFVTAEDVTAVHAGGISVVTVQILARTVQFSGQPTPKMTQAEARDIFAARNPSAFGGTSA